MGSRTYIYINIYILIYIEDSRHFLETFSDLYVDPFSNDEIRVDTDSLGGNSLICHLYILTKDEFANTYLHLKIRLSL